MVKVAIAALLAVLWPAGPLLAQSAPQPGSGEIKRLDFYVGKWDESGRSRTDPSAEFGKLSGEESCEWFPGGHSVVCRETTTDPSGRTEGLYILSYDSSRRVYGVAGVDSAGNVYAGTGVIEGGVWVWDVDAAAGDATMRQRYRFRAEGPEQRSMEIEVPKSDGSWRRVTEATYRRKKSR